MTFYLELTDQQAESIMETGLQVLFGDTTTAFDTYTTYTHDAVGDKKYWKVKNIQKKGIQYDCIAYVNDNLPTLTQYSQAFVDQFLVEPVMV